MCCNRPCFHEKSPGVWLERVPARRRRPTPTTPALDAQVTQAKTLLEGVETFIQQTEASSKKPGRLPVEIEELFQHKTDLLDQVARALERSLTEANTTDTPAAVTTLIRELNEARERLYSEGSRVRVAMIKQQPPTASRVEWLVSKDEIDIVRNGERRRLKGPRKDFLQEYEIRERSSGQVLWYAHFHYASQNALLDTFTAAHLKLLEQRLLAGAMDLRSATSNPQLFPSIAARSARHWRVRCSSRNPETSKRNLTMTPSHENTESPVLLQKSQVIHQTSQGPTVNEVATQVLRKALKALYPDQDLDPDHVLVGTPQWKMFDDTLVALPARFESLSQILVRQFFTAARANYLEGEHFLTANPQASPVVHLDVSIEAIAELLNDYTPLLFVGFGERQLDYWNSSAKHLPRWQDLSDALRKTFDVQRVAGWDEVQCRVARAVSLHPDKSQRQAHDRALSGIRVGLIDVDTVDSDGSTRHLLVGGAAVLTGRYDTRDLVMMYTVEGGYESFDSLEQLGDLLPARIGSRLAGRNMNWQLFEPEGNFFDYMAWALVASQLDAITAITRESVAAEADGPVEQPAPANHPDTPEKTSLAELDNAIPDWLFGASAVDLDDYSRSINALGKLYKQVDKDLFRIQPVTTFAQQRMREAIVADQPTATALPFDNLEISITNSFEAGGLTLPNPHDIHSETLGEYALQNSAPYQASIRFKPSQPVPQWLTVAYLTKMASQVDIGEHYPALIKNKLIDDTVQASLQQHFYISQLRALLPLIALECKIRRRGGIDERGYGYVRQWLNPTPGHPQPIAIRPLTFVHAAQANGDTVDNMFIIAPRQPDGGPCLLYRPLFEQPLLQFPSVQNLLYALHQPGELRDSVLAWLPDSATSFKYAQYSFPIGLPSPWLAAQLLSEPWTSLDWAGPVELSISELTGDVFSVLFKTHAQAMTELADRQSLSNAQRRWDLLRDSGWALFNVAANFLSGPAGAAVWVWQSLSEIDQALEASKRGDPLGEWSAVGDMLLNLGILLAHHAAVRRKTGTRQVTRPSEPVVPRHETPKIEPTLPTATLISTPLTGELPSTHYSSLEINGSVPRRSLTALIAYLQTLTVPAPDLTSPELETLLRETATLYRLGEKTYAQVGERWFCVKENDDQQVQLVHPHDSEKTGPLLVHNQQGHWFVDTRLRLRGGAGGSSLQSQLRAQRKEKAEQKKTLGLALEGFKRREAAGNATLHQAQTDMMEATGSAHEQATERYLEQVETLIGDYSEALKDLQQWRLMGGSEGYLNDLLSMTTHLQKNLSLWFVLKRNTYATLTRRLAASTVIDSNVLLQTHIEGVRQALALSQDMIARLQLSASSLASLDAIGSAGMAAAQHLRQLLPSFNEWDLKSNEIGMSHELCLRDGANVDNEPPREVVGELIIDAAAATHRHAALIRSPQGADGANQRIDALSRLLDIYADADQRFEDLPGQYPDRVQPTELARVRGLLGEFRQLAQNQLGALLPESGPALAPALPKPAVAGPSRPPAKVTKSRPREPITPKASSPAEASFKEIFPARPKPAAPPEMDDTDIIIDGLDLNENVQGFIERTRKDAAKPNRIPADMQDLFDLQALRLEQASIRVTQTMARLRAAGKTTPPVGDLGAQLKSAAVELRAAGVSTRASLLKERQPRQAYLHWLLDNQQVRIERNEQGRIKTKKRRDYFQEYRILDTTNNDRPLWLAHFHYDSLEAPLEQFTAAHLKIADAYLLTFTAERRQALTALAPIDYVLRRINDATLFFKLEPQP